MIRAGWIGFFEQDDFWSGAQKLKDIGYQVLDQDLRIAADGNLEENYKRFTDMGLAPLTVASTSFDLAEVVNHAGELIEAAHIQNVTRATAYMSSLASSIFNKDGRDGTYDEMMRDVESINRLVDIFEKEGIHFCYHNHFQEFANYYNGVCGFDHLLINCDPRLMFDLDVGWATVGGAEPVKIMKRIEGRIACVHMKDFYDTQAPKKMSMDRRTWIGFTSVGSGVVDIGGVLEEMARQGIRDAIVEQDALHNLGLFESLEASYLRLKESGFVE